MSRLSRPGRHRIAIALVIARASVGTAALLAPAQLARVMGFPAGVDTPTTRLLARFFGLREIAIAAATLRAGETIVDQPSLMTWNAAVDGADACLAAMALLGRRGIDRAALGTIALALPLSLSWLGLRQQAD